ncbi:hypothetical protein BAE44_0007511, partial [Dichanthelium oligosanthes]
LERSLAKRSRELSGAVVASAAISSSSVGAAVAPAPLTSELGSWYHPVAHGRGAGDQASAAAAVVIWIVDGGRRHAYRVQATAAPRVASDADDIDLSLKLCFDLVNC